MDQFRDRVAGRIKNHRAIPELFFGEVDSFHFNRRRKPSVADHDAIGVPSLGNDPGELRVDGRSVAPH